MRLETYPLPPGCCAVCRGNALPTIDLQVNTDDLPVEYGYEQSGWAYLCVNCVTEAARLCEMLTRREVEHLSAELAEVREDLARTRDLLGIARERAEALATIARTGDTPAHQEVPL